VLRRRNWVVERQQTKGNRGGKEKDGKRKGGGKEEKGMRDASQG
jgi:hypothetical protein